MENAKADLSDVRVYDCPQCGSFDSHPVKDSKCPMCGSLGLKNLSKQDGGWRVAGPCPKCKGEAIEVVAQTWKDGKKLLRMQCAKCGTFFRHISRVRPAI